MKLLWTGLLTVLLTVSMADAKPKTNTVTPKKPGMAVKKGTPKPNPKQKHLPKQQEQFSETLTYDGLFIQGRKLEYEVKRHRETNAMDEAEEGWNCHKKHNILECVQDINETITCMIEKSEEKGQKGSKDYARKSEIKCEHKAGDLSYPESYIEGCWIFNSDGLTHKGACVDEGEGDDIFHSPVVAIGETKDGDDECAGIYSVNREREGLWCKTSNSTCGDGMEFVLCFDDVEGLVSLSTEFTGGFYEKVSITLKNPIIPQKGVEEQKKNGIQK